MLRLRMVTGVTPLCWVRAGLRSLRSWAGLSLMRGEAPEGGRRACSSKSHQLSTLGSSEVCVTGVGLVAVVDQRCLLAVLVKQMRMTVATKCMASCMMWLLRSSNKTMYSSGNSTG